MADTKGAAAWWWDGVQTPAVDVRRCMTALMGNGTSRPLGARNGSRPGSTPCTVSGSTVTVPPRAVLIDPQGTNTQAPYLVSWSQAQTVTVDPASSLARLDAVWVRLFDGVFDSTGQQAITFGVAKGTPAAQPVAASTLPDGTPLSKVCVLDYVFVPATGGGASVVRRGPVATAAGARVIVADATERLGLAQWDGLQCKQLSTGVTYESNGTTWTATVQPTKLVLSSTILPSAGAQLITGAQSVNGYTPPGCTYTFTAPRDGFAHVTTRIDSRAVAGGFGHGLVQVTVGGVALFQSTWIDFVVRDNIPNWENADVVRSPVAIPLTEGQPVTLGVFTKSDAGAGQWQLTSLQFVVETE